MTTDDELEDLLNDPAVWAEPSPGLEARIVAAIAEQEGAAAPAATPLRPRPAAARVSGNRWRYAAAGVAAAVALVVGTVALVARDDGADGRRFEVALAATELVPDAAGDATLTQTSSGWQIELDATGLPRLDRGRFYQAWLLDDAGVGVPVGTFNEGERVTLWAGASPLDFATLSITEERADGDQASSGRRVLTGTIEAGGPGSG